MNIKLITVGKLKEKYLKQGVEEYLKRISRYAKIEIIEVNDEKTPDNASQKDECIIKDREGYMISKHIKENSYVIAMDLKGKMQTSEEFAKFIKECGVQGRSNLVFIIGGSLGISKNTLDISDEKICFSKMTFPHQLFRVMLLEQIYRGFRINNGEPYHK